MNSFLQLNNPVLSKYEVKYTSKKWQLFDICVPKPYKVTLC